MSYSIFKDTMVDMTYVEIEKAAQDKASILFPISVVEEHGPHMCTGTDIYLTQTICEKLKKRLGELGINTLIAPPFYWGVNSITNGFTGSFVIKAETMITVLLEILENFKRWGFENIFLINFHGDVGHIRTIIKLVEKAQNEKGIQAYFVNDENTFRRLGLSGDEEYLVKTKLKGQVQSKYIDIHAGGVETSWMVKDFESLVNINMAKELKSSYTEAKDLREWLRGGETAKKVTPYGYCGTPSNIDVAAINEFEKELIEAFSIAIKRLMDNIKCF